MLLLDIGMFIIPPVFAWIIHNYLRHGEMSGKRKFVFLIFYFLFVNLCTFSVSWLRGIKGLYFADMTLSYHLKYMGLGCLLACILPFFVCLLFEEQITIGGMIRYARRFLGDIRKYFPYAVRAARADLRAEVANSYLDWLWWLIEPFCMMLIYTLIFGVVFNAAEEYFPIFIFSGITLWGFFQRSISGSIGTVRANKDIITKIYMPKYILLFSKMLVNGFKMLVSLGVVAVMLIIFRVPITWNVIWSVPVLIVLFLFTFGLGTILMHFGVYVNDLGYIIGIVLSMMMYFTGTFYSISKRVPKPYGVIIEKCNPIAFLIASLRDSILYGKTPDLGLIGLWGIISIFLIILGVFTIYSNENAYVKVI